MKRYLLGLLMVGILLVAPSVQAQDNDTEAGLTPDSVWYFLDKWSEAVQGFFTFGDEAKIDFYLELASERISETYVVIENERLVQSTLKDFNKLIEKLNRRLDKVINEDENKANEVAERVAERTGRHLQRLDEIKDQASPAAQSGLEQAIEASAKAHSKAMESVETDRAEQIRDEFRNLFSELLNEVEEYDGLDKIDREELKQLFIDQLQKASDRTEELRNIFKDKLENSL